MLLWRARIAAEALAAGAKDTAFYEGQILGAEFFMKTLLPQALGRMEGILSGCNIANEMSEDAFGGR
jgi:hypothetical protein